MRCDSNFVAMPWQKPVFRAQRGWVQSVFLAFHRNSLNYIMLQLNRNVFIQYTGQHRNFDIIQLQKYHYQWEQVHIHTVR